LLAIAVPLATAAALGRQIRDRLGAMPASTLTHRLERLAAPAAAPAVALILVLTLAISGAIVLRPIDRSGDAATPAAALAEARSMGASGPVFNSHPYGGYLISEGVPVF